MQWLLMLLRATESKTSTVTPLFFAAPMMAWAIGMPTFEVGGWSSFTLRRLPCLVTCTRLVSGSYLP